MSEKTNFEIKKGEFVQWCIDVDDTNYERFWDWLNENYTPNDQLQEEKEKYVEKYIRWQFRNYDSPDEKDEWYWSLNNALEEFEQYKLERAKDNDYKNKT